MKFRLPEAVVPHSSERAQTYLVTGPNRPPVIAPQAGTGVLFAHLSFLATTNLSISARVSSKNCMVVYAAWKAS